MGLTRILAWQENWLATIEVWTGWKEQLGVQEYFQNVCGFSYVSNCTTSEMETGFQQILKLEKTVKSNWLGQEIHSK